MELRSMAVFGAVVSLFLEVVSGSNLLIYSVANTASHFIVINPVASRLASNGHNVTFIASSKVRDEDPKIHYFYPKVVVDAMGEALRKIAHQDNRGKYANVYSTFYPTAIAMCEGFYGSPEVRQWMDAASFDLVIIDATHNECALGLAHKFRAPHMVFQTGTFYNWHYDLYGIPAESSWIPDLRTNITQEMTFLERTWNTLASLHMYLYTMSWEYYPALTETIRKGLGDETVPTVPEMMRQVRLMLVNSYFAAEYARSLPPFVVPIGGAHIRPIDRGLPQNIENFISKFPNGFMYVSFGTAFMLSAQSQQDLHAVMTEKFPEFGFVVKSMREEAKTEANNVLYLDWAPQQELLAHPRIRAFLSHCGMLSVNEVAYYGVPVLAAPGFVDQDYNADCLVTKGGAVRIELVGLNQATLQRGIREILYNDSYKKRMLEISNIYRDRQQEPLDTAVWWTEFVIRHGHAGNALDLEKPLGIHQPWYQRRHIDIYTFIFVILAFIAVLLWQIGKIIYYKICTRESESSKLGDTKQKLL